MEESVYSYQLKPLVIPGGIYLITFPIVVAILWFLLKIPKVELSLLLGVYFVTALGIVALWLFAQSKSLRVEPEQIVLKNLMGAIQLTPQEIRRIALFTLRNGKEVVQIKTKHKDYYLTDLYFPFPELMSDLEHFIKNHGIRSNFTMI